eukprot:gene16042-19322_t
MNNKLLLPNKYKVIGWIVFLVFAVMGIATLYFEFNIPGFVLPISTEGREHVFDDNAFNLTNETALAGTVIGLLMICFAREPKEDEYISLIRLRCWQWSVLASYIVLLVLNFSLYGMSSKMKNSIKVQRAIKNLTQAELANLMQVSRQTVNSMELGKYVPSTILTLKLARIFEKPVEEIFELEEGD